MMAFANVAHLRELSRQGAQSVYCGDHRALCRVLALCKMYVDTRDASLAPHLMMDGYWEIETTTFVLQWLTHHRRDAMRVVNVGANFGYYALICAPFVKATKGVVHAIEPQIPLCDMMRASAKINGLSDTIVVSECGCGAQTSYDERLEVSAGNYGAANFLALQTPTHWKGARTYERAQLRPLDEIVGADPVDLLIIDVEGYEQRVWQGAKGVLENSRVLGRNMAVVMEFSPLLYDDPADFVQQIMADGFDIYELTSEGKPYPVKNVSLTEQKNLVLLKP